MFPNLSVKYFSETFLGGESTEDLQNLIILLITKLYTLP